MTHKYTKFILEWEGLWNCIVERRLIEFISTTYNKALDSDS